MKHREHDHIAFFPRRWLAEVLTHCRTVDGLLQLLRTGGGLHPRYTKIDDGHDLSVENFVRIEVNKAMIQDYESFMKQWNDLGKMIYDFGDKNGDKFNKQYKKT
jgi:hypothetical protein